MFVQLGAPAQFRNMVGIMFVQLGAHEPIRHMVGAMFVQLGQVTKLCKKQDETGPPRRSPVILQR